MLNSHRFSGIDQCLPSRYHCYGDFEPLLGRKPSYLEYSLAADCKLTFNGKKAQANPNDNSVCIISVIRLIVLSRLTDFDVTCRLYLALMQFPH